MWQIFSNVIRKERLFPRNIDIYGLMDKKPFFKMISKNLADTLIPSSVIYLIFMGRTGPCDLI